jgi:hypothetical protein
MSRFLDKGDLEGLTGYKKPALQCRWLSKNSYSFDMRADGRPVVSSEHYESRQGGAKRKRASVPDLAAVERLL